MTHKEQLIQMFEHAGMAFVEYIPDESDRKRNPEWASSITFGSDYDDGPTITALDFDESGNLLFASSFLDPAYGFCAECGEVHEREEMAQVELQQATKPPEFKN